MTNNLTSSKGFSSKALLIVLFVAVVFFVWLGFDGTSWRSSDRLSPAGVNVPTTETRNGETTAESKKTEPALAAARPAGSSDQNPESDDNKPSFRIIGLGPESEPAPSGTDSSQPPVDIPLGDLSISGRVLTNSGTPVAGAEVTATVTYIFEDGRRKYVPRGARQRVATTMHDGSYAFDNLANGEYHVGTKATRRYGRAWIQVRAGVNFADLVVTTHQELRVQGVVTTANGEPLAGAKVRPQLMDANEAATNRDGRYSLGVILPDTATALSVRATRNGYEDRDVVLPRDERNISDVRELNIIMEPEAPAKQVVVKGAVTGSDSEPIAGQSLTLWSPTFDQSHRTTTDADGGYSFGGVKPGDDYAVSLNAPNGYEDWIKRNIVVSGQGLTLNIELKDLETGVLRGHMVNVFGNAVPDFGLVLKTVESSFYNQQVIGDHSGRFEVTKAPAGELRLRTNSNPYYSIEGIRLAPGEERDVRIVLDWGYDEILGRVVDQNNSPVAAPNVTLTWNHMENGIRTSVRRTAAADAQGHFRFTQLGPGNHQLRVNAPGYRPASVVHDPSQQGSNLRVELVEQ